ncbi:MAG: voltage-gated chloride channel family protein [Bacteroidales bacterium]
MNRKPHPILVRWQQIPALLYLFKWLFLCLLVGALAGTASAWFLVSLDWATRFRESHTIIVFLLPLGGLVVGLLYHYMGKSVAGGNDLILDELHRPGRIVPLKMAPLVFVGSVITHFFGGSAGREGTAVQMGGAIADQFSWIFRLRQRDRVTLLIAGVSAGFASIFGTPLAGAVFALEVVVLGRMRYEAMYPAFLAALIGDQICHLWGVPHMMYEISIIPPFALTTALWVILAGIVFGLAGLVYAKLSNAIHNWFSSKIAWAPFRPFVGGFIVLAGVLALGSTRYLGLGVPVIAEAFQQEVPVYDFLFKILFTAITLGSGFKGGEVTPLFFIGATLGNALVWLIPLPFALLAAMGFVAVFAGATNTPIACTLMGIELFGADAGIYIGLACVTAYFFSGHSGIYGSQIVGSPKHLLFGRHKGKKLRDL